MKIMFASFEASPFAKVGGLGDVAGSLPPALAGLGQDIRLIMPKYGAVPEEYLHGMEFLFSFNVKLGAAEKYAGVFRLVHRGVTAYFIDNEEYFHGGVYGYGGEAEADRVVFFCRAAIECLPRLDFWPDIFHCNDWHTGLIPALLKEQYPALGIKTLFTIHNLKYQGLFSREHIQYLTGLRDGAFTMDGLEFHGAAGLMKGGLLYSDRVNTVSPRYAAETLTPEYGEGLERILAWRGQDYCGILNGIDYDVFNPETDPALPQNFSAADPAGKAVCKAALCGELGLDPALPMTAVVSRLVEQKGFDLLAGSLDELLENRGFTLAVLGTGDKAYEDYFSYLAGKFPGRVAVRLEYSEALSRRIYAGADIFLMPSRFEPCGLSQMISMRYGTVPLVRETGGLADSVLPYNEYEGSGNGFAFGPYAAHDFAFTLSRALGFFGDRRRWSGLVRRAMNTDFSWEASAKLYIDLYSGLKA